MHDTKQWIRIWGLTVSILFVIALINYIVDPYQQYRKASFYKIPFEGARELNAGLAKNFQFDSVVIGTSMMENFNLKDLRDILHFPDPIKLTMPGCSVYEQNLILRTAFRHQKIDSVLVGIDFLSYYGDIHRFKYGEAFFPTYLYDENIFNDYKYLFSSDTFAAVFEMLTAKRDNEDIYDYDKMYEWKSRRHRQNPLSAIEAKWRDRAEFDNKASEREKALKLMEENFRHNLLPLVDEHPETHYIVLFPPYSILAFKTYEERRQLKKLMVFKAYIVNTLINRNNVSIYDFQFGNAKIYQLQNYYDLYHYDKEISRWTLQQIKEDRFHVVDKQSYQKQMDAFVKEVKAFSVSEKLFEIKE